MALGYLLILFIGITVISTLGIIFLLLSKNDVIKKIMFYMLSILSILICGLEAISSPTNFIFQQIIAWLIGLISVIAIIIHVKCNKKYRAYILTIVSLILGILKLFSFI